MNCLRRCQHESTAVPRETIRRMVLVELLNSAAEVEARKGCGVNDVAGLAIPVIPAIPGPLPPPTVRLIRQSLLIPATHVLNIIPSYSRMQCTSFAAQLFLSLFLARLALIAIYVIIALFPVQRNA